jgi:putative ABC transport system permease protein
MPHLRLWMARLLHRDEFSRTEREVDEEFRFHLDMKTASLVAEGMEPDEARRAAVRCFGDLKVFREAAARSLADLHVLERRRARVDWLGQDVRDGFRQMVRRPGFTFLAVATLALGLTTSTAVFAYVNAYSRPFPGAHAEGVFQVYLASENSPFGALSYPDLRDLAEAADGRFEVAASARPQFAASVRHETLTEVVFGEGVTGTYFPLLRVEISLGRSIDQEDDRPDASPVVVISHEYWVRRYASDPGVLGRTIRLNNQPYSIIGVAGPDFLGSAASFRPQVWLPMEQYKRVYWARTNSEVNREAGAMVPYVRLAKGFEVPQARQALAAVARALDAQAPLADRERRLLLEPATWISPATRSAEASTTRIMVLAAALLLLLACANVANLVLSSGARRQREMALRSALGASRARLMRQLLTESLLLSTAAGVLALAAAAPAGRRLSSYFASPSVWGANAPREIALDPRVMIFALGVAVLTGVVTGVIPAFRVSGRSLGSALNSGGRSSAKTQRRRRIAVTGIHDLFVAAQVALSVILIFFAGLVLRTLESARHVDAGFNTTHTLASYVSTSSMGLAVAEREPFFENLIRRFADMPWVVDATVAAAAPLSGHPAVDLRIDGSDGPVSATVAQVWPGYFDVMDMEILRGRALVADDTSQAAGVAVVNEALARRMADDGDIVGRRLWWPGDQGAPDRGFEVVGVVRDARQTSFLDVPEPVAYFSLPQSYSRPGNAFLVKVVGDPVAMVDRMEQELHRVDPRLAIVNILPYSEVVRGFLYPQRMNAELFTIIAGLGLLLVGAGVFGVVALAVARRRREIGIRIAVGAGRPSIVGLVLTTVSAPLVVGLITGAGGAVLLTRVTGTLVWGISPADPIALGAGAMVLLGAVAIALINPIRRALLVDPVASLHAE